MKETRVSKFKEYRQNLSQGQKEVLPISNEEENIVDADEILSSKPIKTPSSTLSVPYDEIMKATKSSESHERLKDKNKLKKILKYALISLGVIALIVAIIVIAVLVF